VKGELAKQLKVLADATASFNRNRELVGNGGMQMAGIPFEAVSCINLRENMDS
jgi:hypothetical protein